MKRYLLGLFFGASLVLVNGSIAEALTISPVKIEAGGNPGQTLVGKVELLNEQAEAKVLYPSYENFEPSGETGSPHFVGAKDGLATWIQAGGAITLGAGEKVEIPYSISIPSDAEPGGYFSAIFWSGQDPASQQGGEVSVGGRLGVLVFLRVAGDIEEGGGVLDFSAGNRFFEKLPIAFTYRINNTGDDRIVPLGTIRIQNTFRSTVSTLSANVAEGSILPDSARRFESVWSEGENATEGFFAVARQQWQHFHLGWYTANLDLSWGVEEQKTHTTYHFFIVPWQLLTLVGVALLVGWFILRRYNRWIITRSAGSR